MIPLEPTTSRASRARRSHQSTPSHHLPPPHAQDPTTTSHLQPHSAPLDRTTSPRPETVRSVETAGYAAPVPVGDGVVESAVAPFHSHPDDEVSTAGGGREVDEAARIEELIGPPPDGGRDAWLCVIAAFGQQFAMFGLSESRRVAIGVEGSKQESKHMKCVRATCAHNG